MSLPGDAAVQEQAEPVVGEVAESEADPFDAFDQQVDRLGGAVAGAGGGEVGQQLVLSGGDGPPEPVQFGHFGNRAGPVEGLQPAAGLGQGRRGVDVA